MDSGMINDLCMMHDDWNIADDIREAEVVNNLQPRRLPPDGGFFIALTPISLYLSLSVLFGIGASVYPNVNGRLIVPIVGCQHR